MLSRIAERMYWMARYLERVESTARLVKVYANLLMDLPQEIDIGWYNLVVLNSGTENFAKRYKNRDERNVVKFMLADEHNPGSLGSALVMARENIRTSRDALPVETWEMINDLSIYARANMKRGVNRRHRQKFLDTMIGGVQQINGLLNGNMSHDAAWQFMRLGRNLERADMTTRSLDAAASVLMRAGADTSANLNEIVWGNMLSSLSAYHPYRRSMRTSIAGAPVARYLLEDTSFPRAVGFCMVHIHHACTHLPRAEPVVERLSDVGQRAFGGFDYEDLSEPFRDYLNTMQLHLADLHGAIEANWFELRDA